MKSNFIKYIFVIFVIGIMGFAIYTLNKEENKTIGENEEVAETIEEETIKEITLGIAEYDTINPILSQNKYVQEISRIIYEPLLEIDEEYKIKKCLVKDWAKTSAVTYLFKLKEGIKWSDGQPVTVGDVIFTIDKLKRIPSIYSYNVQYVVRTDEIDEYTLQITLDHEIPFFEYNMIFPIMSGKYYEGQDFQTTPRNNMPVGTGKYKIVKNDGEGIVLNKNENYTGDELTLETINIGKFTNIGELYNAFKLGKVDVMSTTNPNIQDNIGTMGYNIKESAGREYDYLAINTQVPALSEKEVRKAIACAINRENIIGTLYNNKYKVTNYPLDFGSYLRGENSDVSYSIERANQTLEAAGWTLRNNKWQKVENYNTKTINIRLVVQASNQTRLAVAEMIKSSLEEIAIKVTIIKASDSQYEYYLKSKNYDMIITGITQSNSPNLETFLGADNLSNYNNGEITTILNEVKNITKEDLLIEKYKRIREIYNDEMPYIGLYNSYYAVLSSWNLKGNVNTNWYNIFMDIDQWYKN